MEWRRGRGYSSDSNVSVSIYRQAVRARGRVPDSEFPSLESDGSNARSSYPESPYAVRIGILNSYSGDVRMRTGIPKNVLLRRIYDQMFRYRYGGGIESKVRKRRVERLDGRNRLVPFRGRQRGSGRGGRRITGNEGGITYRKHSYGSKERCGGKNGRLDAERAHNMSGDESYRQ